MKHKHWFHVLLFLSILVLTTPALAFGPPRPVAKPLGEQNDSLPGETTKAIPGPRPASEPASQVSAAGILLSEGFEGGAVPPSGGWSTISVHPSRNWTITEYPDWVHSGSFAAWVEWDDETVSDEWLLSPVIDLTAISNAFLEFWALSLVSWCPSSGSGADVLLHVTDSGGTPIDTVWNLCSESWLTWEYRPVSIDLSPFQGMEVRLAWQYVGINGIEFVLDDILLTGSRPGYVDGYITDANMALPLANANIYLSGITDPGFEDRTWSNAEGYYVFGPLLAGDYKLRAAAYGYQNGNEFVTVTEGLTTTTDIEMTASMPDLSHTEVHVQVPPDSAGTTDLTLENYGTGDLSFHISEVPYDAPFPGPASVLQMPDPGIPTSERPTGKMPAGIAAEVYAELAASPDGTAPFIVYLTEQADLSAAFGIDDWSARGHYVLDRLQSVAERTQAGLRAELDRAGVVYRSYAIINALVVEGDLELAEQLVARPETAGIGPNSQILAPAPAILPAAAAMPEAVEWNIHKVRADQVWSGFGVTGSGIVVANIDTGVQWNHPALVNQYRGSAADHNYNWWDPYGDRPNAPEDPHGHGTLTMGIMVGDDGGSNQIGMAPGASWFACNGFKNGGVGSEAQLLECAEFVLAPWDLSGANPDPALRADVVNNSWGSGQAQWWYNQAVYAWRAAGIFPVFSAGSSGPACGTVGHPGDMASVLSVGATDAADSNATGSAASVSSRGPAVVSGLVKPDVSAPGAGIRSSTPGSTYQGGWNGTSVAAPHVAGEVALIWSAQPALRGDVQLTQWIIEQNTSQLLVDQGYFCGDDDATSVPNNQYGWGRIDAYDAVDMAVSDNWDIPWLAVNPTGGFVAPHTSLAIELAFDTAGLAASTCYLGTLKFEYNDPDLIEEFLPVELCVRQDANIYLPLVIRNW